MPSSTPFGMTHLDEGNSFLTSLLVQASSVTTLLPTFTASERCYGGIFLRHRYHDVIHHCKSSSGFPVLKAKVKTLRERPCRASFPSLSGSSSSLMSEHFSAKTFCLPTNPLSLLHGFSQMYYVLSHFPYSIFCLEFLSSPVYLINFTTLLY